MCAEAGFNRLVFHLSLRHVISISTVLSNLLLVIIGIYLLECLSSQYLLLVYNHLNAVSVFLLIFLYNTDKKHIILLEYEYI